MERRLTTADSVDFDDMIVTAAGLIEAGYDTGFDLVLVDEFQDVSAARARLARALVAKPGRFLLAVGDDWQAINRFAGADLSVMTRFGDWFGPHQRLALTTTFRCPQTICDTATAFVTANPAQFTKPMRSVRPDPGPAVRVVCDDDPRRALAGVLRRISADAGNSTASVDVLGRYGFQRDHLGQAPGNLTVQFRTVHSSKGLEADHIVIVGLTAGRFGFPSRIVDNPVLSVAMPNNDPFPHAEERRLFYVALTRARQTVTIIAPTVRMSPFVTEILDDRNVTVETAAGATTPAPVLCSECRSGSMTRRTNSRTRQAFLGCTNFPACRHTQQIGR